MAGQKREARLRARCPGHPRLNGTAARKTWMAGTSGAKTRFALLPGHDEKTNRFFYIIASAAKQSKSCHSGAMRSIEPGISRFPDVQSHI